MPKKTIAFLFLMALTQCCLDPEEAPGQCSACPPTQILTNGSCYPKIRGCLTQLSDICESCQQGYILVDGLCQREAIVTNNSNLTPPPVVIEPQPQVLSQSEIKSVKVGGFEQVTDPSGDNPFYTRAEEFLKSEYPEMAQFQIYKVEQQIVNGVNYLLYLIDLTDHQSQGQLQSSSYDLYLARIYVSLALEAEVIALFKNEQNMLLGNNEQIHGSQQPPVIGGFQQFGNLTDDLYLCALNKLTEQYPSIYSEGFELEQVEYQIVAGTNFLIFYTQPFSESNFIAKVYVPFIGDCRVLQVWNSSTETVTQQSQQQTVAPQPGLAGGYSPYPRSEYDREPFLTAKRAIETLLSLSEGSITNENIISAQEQIVSGVNYIIEFVFNGDVFDVELYVPLINSGLEPEFSSIKKNGQSVTADDVLKETDSAAHSQGGSGQATNIGSEVFNWQMDSDFRRVYNHFIQNINIQNIPPSITEVQRTLIGAQLNIVEYKIIYSEFEYAIVRDYVGLNNFIEILSYKVDGMELYRNGGTLGAETNQAQGQRSESVLLSFIKSHGSSSTQEKHSTLEKFVINGKISMTQLSNYTNLYILTVYSQSGKHEVQIIDDGQLYLAGKNLISQAQTCFDIRLPNAGTESRGMAMQQTFIVQQLAGFVQNKYNLTDFFVTVAKAEVVSAQLMEYRIVLTHRKKDGRQILVKVQEMSERYIIKQIISLNDGMRLLPQGSQAQSEVKTPMAIEQLARTQYSMLSTQETTDNSSYDLVGVWYKLDSLDSLHRYEAVFTNGEGIFTYQYSQSNDSNIGPQHTATITLKQPSSVDAASDSAIQNCEQQIRDICRLCSISTVRSEDGRECVSSCDGLFEML